ncbi:tetratricopeptide repeat protein [soil metagenome]
MMLTKQRPSRTRQVLLLVVFCLCPAVAVFARPAVASPTPSAPPAKALPVRHSRLDDSVRLAPPPDLALQVYGQRRADALATFVAAARLEESGEVDAALAAYQKVLIVDPGEVDLASRVASLLVTQDDVPRAVDVLKDAIKAKPKESGPYLQLALIYAKYLRKPAQALKYADQAIALDPQNIDTYQRLYEIELATGDPTKALAALDRASKVPSKDGAFWTQLGKLYASIFFKPGEEPIPEDIERVNTLFRRAVKVAPDDAGVVKDAADYFAASQQIPDAIPLYLKVLELEPDDANAREKLATGFVVTNQREKAIATLREITAEHPERFQPYLLLAQLLDEGARELQREEKPEAAKAEFAKAAAAYQQSLLVKPDYARSYLRLGELLVGALKDPARAERVIMEGRLRFPQVPEFSYLLAIAQREAKHHQQAVMTFEEARNEAEAIGSSMLNGRFFFDYGVAAEQAGFYDKAADLLRQSAVLDPSNAAEVYNYLGYMWAEQGTHLDDAEELIKKALELDTDNGAYLDSLGWIKFRKGHFQEALPHLLKAAKTLPKEDPVVLEHIGDTYSKLGREAEAVQHWRKASALAPDNKMLAEKIENAKATTSTADSQETASSP